MSDQLTQDQLDFFGRLQADSYFASIPLLLQDKGLTDSDIEIALSTLNAVGGKAGVVVIVLMPALQPDDASNTAGPRWKPTFTIQVIEQPLINRDPTSGIGKTCSQVAERVRMVLHQYQNGTGATFLFSSQAAVAVDEGKVSLGVAFTRLGGDNPGLQVAYPTIASVGTVHPQTITLACATGGAAIWYTLDGSYPQPSNPTAQLYSAPFVLNVAARLRVAAVASGYRQSSVRMQDYT